MLHAIPALNSAMRDPALRGNPREVYLWLTDRLDLVEYRPVKHEAIIHDLRMRGASVYRSMQTLRLLGYVRRRRAANDARIWNYRLVYSLRAQRAKSPTPPAKTQLRA